MQRFRTPQQLAGWRNGAERARLHAEIAPLLAAGSPISDEEAARFTATLKASSSEKIPKRNTVALIIPAKPSK